MKQKFSFTVGATIGETRMQRHFLTYPEWAEETARQIVDDWLPDTGDNVSWTYWPQYDLKTKSWV